MRVLADFLIEHPSLNAVVDGIEACLSAAVHVGMAIALPGELVAPAVFDAQNEAVEQIASARQDLVERAHKGELTIRETTGGTGTLRNPCVFRVRDFTPMVNAPPLAIVGLGQIAPRPWVDAASEFAVRPAMRISLTTDHRFLDGNRSAAALTAFCERLETSLPLPD